MFQKFDPVSDRSYASQHLPLVKAQLADHGLDGLLIPHDDEYLNEYLPDHAERLMWVSGFSGSAGFGIVLTNHAAVFSDGRYTLQLEQQVDTDFFSLHNSADITPAEWLKGQVKSGAKIGYDPILFSKAGLAPFLKAAAKIGFDLIALSENPIDAAWADQPAPPNGEITPHPEKYSGESSQSKRERLATNLKKQSVDAALLTAPHSLAWLFNIRGGDVHASPLPLGRAILYASGKADLMVAPTKITETLQSHLGEEITILDESSVEAILQSLGEANKTIQVDPDLTPLQYIHTLEKAGANLVFDKDPCALPRATKNKTELDGARQAHIRDGAAVTRFLHWFAQEAPNGDLTEISVAKKLESFRRDTNELMDISFDSISGAAEHGAVVHYRVTTETDKPVGKDTLFLIDSGGQYKDGTTDITRTMAVGTPSADMRKHYTLVLKGHIALALAKFPEGTSGYHLDALARHPLWQAGLDYDHGTGHGVGSYLGVHEGPQKISKHPLTQPLLPGMICSNEPGYYKNGEYGIRIENLVIVSDPLNLEGSDRPVMEFETITLAPLERELIDTDLLTPDERDWVDQYHARVFDTLTPLLDDVVTDWLRTRTAPL